jgi:hypothetical protein
MLMIPEISEAELDRWSAARVGALLALPESNARSFAVAFALGSILDDRGTTRSLAVGSRSPGTLITRKRAARIREVLGISDRRWRQLVLDWVYRGVAHRCSPGVVVLFRKPFLEYCPSASCGEFVEGPGEGPTPAFRTGSRGRPFGSTPAAEAEASLPPGGATTTAGAALRLPHLRANPEHHKEGLLRGDREGLLLKPLDLSSEDSGAKRRDFEGEGIA